MTCGKPPGRVAELRGLSPGRSCKSAQEGWKMPVLTDVFMEKVRPDSVSKASRISELNLRYI